MFPIVGTISDSLIASPAMQTADPATVESIRTTMTTAQNIFPIMIIVGVAAMIISLFSVISRGTRDIDYDGEDTSSYRRSPTVRSETITPITTATRPPSHPTNPVDQIVRDNTPSEQPAQTYHNPFADNKVDETNKKVNEKEMPGEPHHKRFESLVDVDDL